MKATEFITELDPRFVNRQVDADNWKRKGTGATASVWQHMLDPHTVVKVVGAGRNELLDKERNAAIAFVNFLVDHGHESKHLPIIYGINLDDPDVVQIRLEKLLPLPFKWSSEYKIYKISMGEELGAFAYDNFSQEDINNLDKGIFEWGLSGNNSALGISQVCNLLKTYLPLYKKKYKLARLYLDTIGVNWMMRPDKTIVYVDPWYGD